MDKVRLILSLLPQIVALVREIEAMFPNPGSGATKLQAFFDLFRAVYDAIEDAKPAFDSLRPALERVVAAVVAVFNRTGVFKTSR